MLNLLTLGTDGALRGGTQKPLLILGVGGSLWLQVTGSGNIFLGWLGINELYVGTYPVLNVYLGNNLII